MPTTPPTIPCWSRSGSPARIRTTVPSSGDYSTRTGWTCDQDPVAAPELTTQDLGAVTEYFTNGIPGHATGTFPNGGNPNTIQTVFQTWNVPNVPERTGTVTEMATFGVTLDGIKLERDTAESFRNEGEWRYEAITAGLARRQTDGARFTWLGTDCNNAHVQPTGAYHYHGIPESLINRLGEGPDGAADMIAAGFAADGFPFYLRYGYRDPNDPQSGLVAVLGSWMLRPLGRGTRPGGPGGPYDGTFREDWEYVEGSGDLDECNGPLRRDPGIPRRHLPLLHHGRLPLHPALRVRHAGRVVSGAEVSGRRRPYGAVESAQAFEDPDAVDATFD